MKKALFLLVSVAFACNTNKNLKPNNIAPPFNILESYRYIQSGGPSGTKTTVFRIVLEKPSSSYSFEHLWIEGQKLSLQAREDDRRIALRANLQKLEANEVQDRSKPRISFPIATEALGLISYRDGKTLKYFELHTCPLKK